jgi:hypothetical protein
MMALKSVFFVVFRDVSGGSAYRTLVLPRNPVPSLLGAELAGLPSKLVDSHGKRSGLYKSAKSAWRS